MQKKKNFCAAVTCETFLFDLNYFGLFIEVTRHWTIQFQAAVQLQNRKLGSEESMLFSLSLSDLVASLGLLQYEHNIPV